jgi:hypothetical protein
MTSDEMAAMIASQQQAIEDLIGIITTMQEQIEELSNKQAVTDERLEHVARKALPRLGTDFFERFAAARNVSGIDRGAT